MSTYNIAVSRFSVNQGTLNYSGNIEHTCDCWWDPADKIPAGKYINCSATYMANKKNSRGTKREGIFFPDVPGRSGIFVHYWNPRGDLTVWSDGCFVLKEADLLKIWNDIVPQDGKNVTIIVTDPPPPPPALAYDMRECIHPFYRRY